MRSQQGQRGNHGECRLLFKGKQPLEKAEKEQPEKKKAGIIGFLETKSEKSFKKIICKMLPRDWVK